MKNFVNLFTIFSLTGLLLASDPAIDLDLKNITSEVSTFQRVPFLPSRIDFVDDAQNGIKALTGELLSAHYKGYLNVPYLVYLTCEGLAVESEKSPEVFGCVGEYLKTATAMADTAIYDAFLKMYPHIQVNNITPETIFETEASYLQFVSMVVTSFFPKLLQVMGADVTTANAAALLTRVPRDKIALRLFTVYGIIITNLEVTNAEFSLFRCCCFFR